MKVIHTLRGLLFLTCLLGWETHRVEAQSASWVPGLTHPVMDSVLGAPNDGVIGERFFSEGETVQAGAVILSLRTDTEKVDVSRRKVALRLAEREYNRLNELAKRTSSVSSERLETAETNFELAKADLELAEARLKDRQVIAPFSGVIADLLGHEVGEGTKVGNPLVRLVDTSKVLLVCDLPAEDGTAISPDQLIAVQVPVGSETIEKQGRVVFVSPIVDAASGLLRIKVEIGNEDGRIRPGVAGSLRIN